MPKKLAQLKLLILPNLTILLENKQSNIPQSQSWKLKSILMPIFSHG